MSSLRDKVSKNFSKTKKTEFERRVNELSGAMSEMAAIQLVLGEMFREGKEDGGIMGGVSDEIKDPIIRKLKVLPDTLDKIAKKIAPLLGFEPKEIERLLEEEKRKRSKKEDGGIMGGATYEDFEEFMKLQEQMNKEINKKRLLEQFEQYMKRKKLVEVADGGRIGGISKLLGE